MEIPKNFDNITTPRRRTTADRIKQPRINLTARANYNQYGKSQNGPYEDDFLADAQNDIAPASAAKRRAVHFNDIVNNQDSQNTQRTTGSYDTLMYQSKNNKSYLRADEQYLPLSQSSNSFNIHTYSSQPYTSMLDYAYNNNNTTNAYLTIEPDKARLEQELKELRWREKQHLDEIRRLRDEHERNQKLLQDVTEKFQKYRDLRTTEQEQSLAEHMGISQMKEDAYVQLRDQAESIIEKYTAATIDHTPDQQHRVQKVKQQTPDQTPAFETSALKERLFEELTGSIIKRIRQTKDGITYACIISGNIGSFQYTLTFANKDDMIYYSPKIDSQETELLSALPGVYKDHIEFKKMYLPIFYANLSKVVNYIEEDNSQQKSSQQKDAP